jgi:hypothetical protein
LFVDFTKLTPASKAEKAISQLWGTLTCESLTEDLIGLNMFVPKCMSLLDSGSMVSTISVATLKSMHPPPDIKTLDEFTLSVKVAEGSPITLSWICYIPVMVNFDV